MEWYEVAFDRTYPLLYPHRDLAEAQSAIDTFAPYLEGRSPILDLASGGGRYLEALLRAEHQAFGLDLSLYLLEESVDNFGHRGAVVQGDMRQLPFDDETFGAVINMFTSFGYFSADTDNLIVLKEVARVLGPGGVMLFDFINAEHISSSLLDRSERQSGDYAIAEERRIEGHGKYLVKNATVTNRRSGAREVIEERLRLYTKRDLEIMFDSVRLAIFEAFGDYNGNAFVDGVSERVILVARKP